MMLDEPGFERRSLIRKTPIAFTQPGNLLRRLSLSGIDVDRHEAVLSPNRTMRSKGVNYLANRVPSGQLCRLNVR